MTDTLVKEQEQYNIDINIFDKINTDVNITSDEEKLSLQSENSFHTLDLRIKDFNDEKSLKKFIKKCEMIIRRSPEYKIWTDYVRNTLGYNICQITGEYHNETTVEIHHHPISLFLYIKAVVLSYIENDKEFCSMDVCIDIIEDHYKLKVPFVLLITSLHEKYHNGFFTIPMEYVKGDHKHFITKYIDYLPEEDKDTINNNLTVNKNNCGWENINLYSRDNG